MDKPICDLTPIAQLNNMMAKLGIIPKYELICDETERSTDKPFKWRVTLPISPGGRFLSAEGRSCRARKEAKHDAALAFMKKFLDCKESIVKADGICFEARDLLKKICLKNNLKRPLVRDVCTEGSSHEKLFIAECRVNDLSIEGKGRSKIEARIEATAKMMQILMETASIHEIIKLKDSRPRRLQLIPFNNKTHGDEKLSPDNNLRESKALSGQNCANGKRKIDAELSEAPEKKFKAHSKPDVAKYLVELMIARDKAKEITKNNNNSAPVDSGIASSQDDMVITKSRTILLGKNDVPERINLIDSHRNLTRLQAMSQIDRTLGNLEKELHVKILNALPYGNLSHRQIVGIYNRKYEIFVYPNSPIKIFDGNNECTDASIRIACLTKLLINFRKYIETNHVNFVKCES